MAVTSVDALDPSHHPECMLAKGFVRKGHALLEKRAWRPAEAAFCAATHASAVWAFDVGDCYDAAGDAAKKPHDAVYCHRQAKRFYKRVASQKDVAGPAPAPTLGLMWQSLGVQYSKLSRLKHYNAHDNKRALSSFSRALEGLSCADRPSAYRGRLDAATHWLAQKRRCMWFGRKQHQRALRALAWEDALMLLRAPSWSAPTTSSWEAVADLSAVCDDDASATSIQRDVLPLLEAALCKPSAALGHGNPWQAALALLAYRKGDVDAVIAAMRRAVRLPMLDASQLPIILACYDRALAVEPLAALSATDDLAFLRARFAQEHHSLGKLVFTANRFLEAAQAYEDKAASQTALETLAEIAMQTSGRDTVDLAVTMLGYVAKRQPEVGEACIAHLTDLALGRGLPHEAALFSDIVATLAACTRKPIAASVRDAARAAMARLDAAKNTRLHAD